MKRTSGSTQKRRTRPKGSLASITAGPMRNRPRRVVWRTQAERRIPSPPRVSKPQAAPSTSSPDSTSSRQKSQRAGSGLRLRSTIRDSIDSPSSSVSGISENSISYRPRLRRTSRPRRLAAGSRAATPRVARDTTAA